MSAVETEEVEPDEEEVCFFFYLSLSSNVYIIYEMWFYGCDFNIKLLFLSHIPGRGCQINADNFKFSGLMRTVDC